MKEILITSIAFSPNVGGIETHFDDLTSLLVKRGWKVWVLTYKPITTKVGAKVFEKRDKKIVIIRIPWVGGLFYKFVKNPILEFLYLTPGLFLMLPIFLLFFGRNINTIHSHGLVSGFISVIWGKIFGKKVITTTHSIYHFPKSGIYRSFAKWIFGNSDKVLTLSKQSSKEIERLGIEKDKIDVFTYWIDLNRFKKLKTKQTIREKLGLKGAELIVLFVGRLVDEKGLLKLTESSKDWDKNISLAIVGSGPLKSEIEKMARDNKNIQYFGRVKNENLPKYYNAADLLVVPSIHEEGFGRVVLESLACGIPVIGSNRGAIPEAMDSTVGQLITITPENIKKVVESYLNNPEKLKETSQNARKFAEKRYSEKNADIIISYY